MASSSGKVDIMSKNSVILLKVEEVASGRGEKIKGKLKDAAGGREEETEIQNKGADGEGWDKGKTFSGGGEVRGGEQVNMQDPDHTLKKNEEEDDRAEFRILCTTEALRSEEGGEIVAGESS